MVRNILKITANSNTYFDFIWRFYKLKESNFFLIFIKYYYKILLNFQEPNKKYKFRNCY